MVTCNLAQLAVVFNPKALGAVIRALGTLSGL